MLSNGAQKWGCLLPFLLLFLLPPSPSPSPSHYPLDTFPWSQVRKLRPRLVSVSLHYNIISVSASRATCTISSFDSCENRTLPRSFQTCQRDGKAGKASPPLRAHAPDGTSGQPQMPETQGLLIEKPLPSAGTDQAT